MFSIWRRKGRLHPSGESIQDTPELTREMMRLRIQRTIQYLDQLEKQIRLVEYDLAAGPDACQSLLRPCAQLDMKLLELQGITEGLMQKLSHSR